MPMPGYAFDPMGSPMALAMQVPQAGMQTRYANALARFHGADEADPLLMSLFDHLRSAPAKDGLMFASSTKYATGTGNWKQPLGEEGQYYTPGDFSANPGLASYYYQSGGGDGLEGGGSSKAIDYGKGYGFEGSGQNFGQFTQSGGGAYGYAQPSDFGTFYQSGSFGGDMSSYGGS